MARVGSRVNVFFVLPPVTSGVDEGRSDTPGKGPAGPNEAAEREKGERERTESEEELENGGVNLVMTRIVSGNSQRP